MHIYYQRWKKLQTFLLKSRGLLFFHFSPPATDNLDFVYPDAMEAT